MSKSISSCIASLLALGLFSIAMASPSSRDPSPADQKNVFIATHDILKAFYPEIFGQGWFLDISAGQAVDNNSWDEFVGFKFKVMRFAPNFAWNPMHDASTGKMTPPSDNPTLLEGSIWTGHDGEILEFFAEGDLASSRKLEDTRALIESHPEWSEEQEIHALKTAGARYGPADKEQFIKSLHWDRAEKLLGPLNIVSVEFNSPNPDHVGSFSAAALDWTVHAEAGFPDGRHIRYSFRFEPFGGKLTAISGMGGLKPNHP